MEFTSRKHAGDSNTFSIFSYSVSHYSIAHYDAFCDDLTFCPEIKSRWSSQQLIDLGKYCDSLYETYNKQSAEN